MNEVLDLLSGTGRTLGKLTHFLRNDGKTLSGLARTRGFNAGIEGKKVGLEGDFVDHPDNLADLVGRRLDLGHRRHGLADDLTRLLGVGARDGHHLRGFLGPRGGLAHRGSDLVEGRSGLFQAGGLLLGAT